MKKRIDRHPAKSAVDKPSEEKVIEIDVQMETKMRILANHVIDRLIEIQEKDVKDGLNISEEKAILIMEHQVKQI